MKRVLIVIALMALVVVALLGTTAIAVAKGGQGGGKGGGKDQSDSVVGVILAYENGSQPVVMSALDGSGLKAIDCGGDLTHGDAPRYFLHPVFSGQFLELPDGTRFGSYDLYAFDENHSVEGCTLGTLLFSDSNMYINAGLARWSPSGTRVAWIGARVNGEQVEKGIFVGSVAFDPSSRPTSIIDVSLAAPLSSVSGVGAVSWSKDNRSVTFHLNVGGGGRSNANIFIADLELGDLENVTNSTENDEYYSAFSPVDNSLVYVRVSGVFVLDLDTGKETQITSKGNTRATQLSQPAWSPDGQHLAFSGWPTGGGSGSNIYRIKADGSGKALNLTESMLKTYSNPLWRK
ncbi:MAG: TolB family protein [Dehalococcoidia bacterium]